MSSLVANEPPIFHGRFRRLRTLYIRRFGRRTGQNLFVAGALEDRNVRSLTELIKMIGIARRIKVNVGIVTSNAGSLHRGVLLLLGQFLAAVIDLLSNKVALLHPPFRPARRTHSSEPPVSIQPLDTFGISYQTCFVV